MNNLSVKVDVLPGTTISDACTQAIALSQRIGVSIEFDFNGTNMYATSGSDVDYMVQEFHKKIARRGTK